jgi:acetyl esterase
VATPWSSVPVRIFRPAPGHLPAIFYLHGGGWTLFGLDSFDRVMRELAATSGCAVIGLDYPLAPEHPFPAAIEACSAVVDGLPAHSNEWGIGGRHFALAGDSAGANLAVGVTMFRRDSGRSLPDALALLYGVYDCDMTRPSYATFGDGSLPLASERMAWFWGNYCPDPATREHPLAAPLRADLRGLPPVHMVIADHDILLCENLAFSQALRAAGVTAEHVVYRGTTHAFIEAVATSEVSRTALARAASWLRTMLS